MSKLQKEPAAHKRGHPTLQNMNFFYFCGSFLPSWIRIRIPNTDPDPDPLARLNTDPDPKPCIFPGCLIFYIPFVILIDHNLPPFKTCSNP
jgi:hypothetical protein